MLLLKSIGKTYSFDIQFCTVVVSWILRNFSHIDIRSYAQSII